MTKIDSYLDSVFRDCDIKSQENSDLKLEMRSHLEHSIKELKESGMTEEESFKVAIERFGEEFQIRNELTQVVKFQKKFNTNILRISFVFLALCIIMLTVSYFTKSSFQDRSNIMNIQIDKVEKAFMMEGITGVDKVAKGMFKYDAENYLTYVAIKELPKDYPMEKDDPNNYLLFEKPFTEELKYSYPENIDNEFLRNSFGIPVIYNNTKYNIEVGVKTTANMSMDGFYQSIATLLFVISWILWIIWSIVSVFSQGKLNTGWVILLIFTGILGYFIFLYVRKSKWNRLAQA